MTVWVIRAGRNGEAHFLFMKKNYIGLGWPLGDLTKLGSDMESFKEAFQAYYPTLNSRQIASHAGQNFRFVHEMSDGDVVIYPEKYARDVHIGKVRDSYRYDPSVNLTFPHIRPVVWLKTVSRDSLLPAVARSLNGQSTLYEVHDSASALLQLIR